MSPWLSMFLPIGATLVIGLIGFFLKRSVWRVLDEMEKTVKDIRENYTPMSIFNTSMDECRSDIKKIKEDYITKEDFFREQAKTDRKLDRIMDILLEMKGDK